MNWTVVFTCLVVISAVAVVCMYLYHKSYRDIYSKDKEIESLKNQLGLTFTHLQCAKLAGGVQAVYANHTAPDRIHVGIIYLNNSLFECEVDRAAIGDPRFVHGRGILSVIQGWRNTAPYSEGIPRVIPDDKIKAIVG